MTRRLSARAAGPAMAASPTPPANDAAAIARAAAPDTRPLGIGFPGLSPASRDASTKSLAAPIPNWSSVIETPRTSAAASVPPATSATAATTAPSSSDGNGWTSRTSPRSRSPDAGPGPSDVDELGEARNQVLDQSRPTIGDLRAAPRHEREQRDGRNHQASFAVPADGRGRPTAGCEHAFEFPFAEPGRAAEVLDDLHDPAADRDVPH